MPMGLGLGLGLATVNSTASSEELEPPEGFAFVTQGGETVTQDGESVYVAEE